MEVTNRKRYLTLRRGKDNRYLSSLLSRIATKVQMLYRRHDSDDEVWCYRSTEETLTLLQASPRDRGRNWESARGNGERLQEDSKMEQQGPERSSKKKKREGEQGDEIHLICLVIHHHLVFYTHSHAYCRYMNTQTFACSLLMPGGGCCGGSAFEAVGRDMKLLLYASINSPLIPQSASRLSVPLSQLNTRKRMR